MADQEAGSVVIAEGRLQDLGRLLEIEAESFSAPWTRKMFEVELEDNPFGHLWTARLAGGSAGEGEVVGYICFWIVFEELRLLNLAVDPRVRRRGVATALVRRALEFGRERRVTRAVLEVRASNAAAKALYERAGFRQVAVRADYYANPVEDAVLMALEPLTVERVAEMRANAENEV